MSHLALVVVRLQKYHKEIELGSFYAAVGAFAGAMLALAAYHVAVVQPGLAQLRRLLDVHDGMLAGGSGTASSRLDAVEAAEVADRTALERVSERVAELETLAATDLSRAGFIRYDAFAGAGAGLSYALALLNRQGDGVVITSIYSREDTRTFGKPVAGFKPTVQASEEELAAIERARSNGS